MSLNLRAILMFAVAALFLTTFSAAGSLRAAAQATPEASPASETSTPQLPVTVTDANGDDVTVTDISRIVPLNGDLAEIIWALGLGDSVVGVDVSATYPHYVRRKG